MDLLKKRLLITGALIAVVLLGTGAVFAASTWGDVNRVSIDRPALNDPTETSSIKQVFGEHARRLALSGTKGYYGHALGASGAIETAICALAMRHGWLPPTVNLEAPDPACDLDFIQGEGRHARPEYLLTNSFGFGGVNASIVLRRE